MQDTAKVCLSPNPYSSQQSPTPFFKYCEKLLPNLLEDYPSSPTAIPLKNKLISLNSYYTR
jgi:hypothetical protein